MELVRDYAANQSAQAFETIVARHIGLVHSAALRQVRDEHLAEEITQTVFIILSRKAGSMNAKTILPGWLYRTTRFVSSAALKMQRRRERREQEALMQAIVETQTDANWEQFSPLLDEAMSKLREQDRDAIVLRYFQNKNLREVGAALGVGEYAAQKRVERALEKLRVIFGKHGIDSTASAIAETISAHSVQAVPALLAKTVAAAAIIKGATASTSTLALMKASMKLMTWLKIKFAVGIGAAVLVLATTATIALSQIPASSSVSAKPTVKPAPPANTPQIFVATAFVKAPSPEEADAIIKDYSDAQSPSVSSPMFRKLINQHTNAELISAPRVITIAGEPMAMTISRAVTVNGTNAEIGVILRATPLLSNSFIHLKYDFELRELVTNNLSPSIRVTADQNEIQITNRLGTFIFTKPMDAGGQSIGQNPAANGETLILFGNANRVATRFQKIIKKAQ